MSGLALARGWHCALARGGIDFLIGAILLYGYVYTAYKYGNPLLGRNDFFRYQEVVLHPVSLLAAPAPFVLRQIPAIVASAIYQSGFHFDTTAVVDSIAFDEGEKRRFLAMILSNGLAVCLSFTVLAGYLRSKLAADGVINSLALFGIFAGWFYFPSAVIAPVTIGWGWLASSLFAVAFLEGNAAITAIACALALFSRETTLIFALAMFMAVRLEGDRGRGIVLSVVFLATTCVLYLLLRVDFTTGYEHQIDPGLIVARLASPNFPEHFFVQLLLGQGLLVLVMLGIALRRPRYACYLLAATAIMAIVALATDVTDVGLLVGESLPFYAAIFILAWSGALPLRASTKPETPGASKAFG